MELDELAKQVAQRADESIRAARNAALAGKEPNMSLLHATRAVADAIKNILTCSELAQRDPNEAAEVRL